MVWKTAYIFPIYRRWASSHWLSLDASNISNWTVAIMLTVAGYCSFCRIQILESSGKTSIYKFSIAVNASKLYPLIYSGVFWTDVNEWWLAILAVVLSWFFIFNSRSCSYVCRVIGLIPSFKFLGDFNS